VRVDFSIATLDEEVWRRTEPGAPHPRRRIEAVAKLNEAGVPSGVLMGAVLPGISDHDDQLREVVDACVEAGAVSVGVVGLHLRPGVKEHFLGVLPTIYPEHVEDYERRYADRAYLPSAEASDLSSRVRTFVAEARRRHHRPALGPSEFRLMEQPAAERLQRANRARSTVATPRPAGGTAEPPAAQLDLGL
jgi:DNA repair photolyase